MSYQPSEATKNLQKLLETVEQKQSDYDRLKAAVLSADIEYERERERLRKAMLAELDKARAEFTARSAQINLNHDHQNEALDTTHAMKTEARDKAKLALDHARTQLRAELGKAGALVEEK